MPDLTGTPGQLDWALLIRPRVEAEFDRVAHALRSASDTERTTRILAILERKRAEVLANPSAGYYIKNWRDLDGQVRRMIADDADYPALPSGKGHRS